MTTTLTRREPTRVPHALIGLASLLALLLTACTSQRPIAEDYAAENHGAEDYGVVPEPPLPVGTPAVDLDATIGIADLDGSVVVELDGGQLTFVVGDADSVASRAVGAETDLRAVSADGTMAALFARFDDASEITVVHQDPLVEDLVFTLDGLVEPEAFSTDGELLYVIDHQISATPGAYRVRPLNLESGRLETILGPTKSPLGQDMNGVGRRQVWSPDGSRLNTLYIRQTHHHHEPGEDAQHSHGEPGTDGFVHILDLDNEWAHCLDLPPSFGGGDLSTTALAVSPDGATLAIADLSAGEIAFASAEELEVTHTIPLPDFEVGEDLYLGLSGGALVLGSGEIAQWYDSTTTKPLGQPVILPAELAGFTSNGDTVLAWTRAGGRPITLRA